MELFNCDSSLREMVPININISTTDGSAKPSETNLYNESRKHSDGEAIDVFPSITSLELDKVQIVVARYREPLKWLENYPFNKCSVIVYNKGDNDEFCHTSNIIKEIKLPNCGLDVHSFLHHIINNYDNLAEITAFFQGSVDLPHKYNRAAETIVESVRRNTTILACNEIKNMKEELNDFSVEQYQMAHPSISPTEINVFTVPCNIRPFGKWYEALFGNIKTTHFVYNHIISIKKEHILRKPKEYYELLMSFVDNMEEGRQPEVVHYFERAWEAIFYPLDDNINYIFS